MMVKVAPVKRRRLVIEYSDSESEEGNVVVEENGKGKRIEKLNLFKAENENRLNGFQRTAKAGRMLEIGSSNGERTRVVKYKPALKQLNHEKLRSDKENWEKERIREKERELFTRRRDGASSISSSSIPVRKRVCIENSGHDKIDQNWRGQTRKLLLDAGWRIEPRPSQTKDCKIAVYISPNGTNYWSMAKAYSAFETTQKCNNNKSIVKTNLHDKKHGKNESPEPSRNSELSVRKIIEIKETDSDSDDYEDYVHYKGKRTVLAWLIDSGIIPKICKVKYIDMKTNKTKLGGRITSDGILCNCCHRILTLSKFELHAGSKQNRFYENIHVEELGISLMKCLLKAWEKEGVKGFSEIMTSVEDPCDDTCTVCGDGGDLILCDSCPCTYHMACLGFQMLPDGDWHCVNCLCKFCKKRQEKGRKNGSDCMLKSCIQCGQKYHEGCVPDKDPICASSSNNSFCGQSCRKIYSKLQRLLGVRNSIEDGFSWTLVRRLDESSSRYQQKQSHVANCNSKIALAFNVMDECFIPILDRRSGINLVHNVVYNYGSNFNRLNFDGFYTFVLEHDDEIISVASVRIHGTKLAEMPFIGTRDMYRKQGMCRLLLNGIESALNSLNIRRLLIPAISELKSTWINNFGFSLLDPLLKKQVRSVNILMFPDIGLLHKPLASDQKYESAKRVCNLGNETKLNAQRRKIENDLFG